MPRLSIVEPNRRWQELRKRMLLAKIDCLICLGNHIYYDMGTANLRYLFQVGGKISPYGAFFIDRDPILWNSVPHMNRPYNYNLSIQDWVSDIRIFSGLPTIAAELREKRLDRGRIGLVAYSSTLAPLTLLQNEMDTLKRELPHADFVDVSWIIEEMRIVKSEEEIDLLRKAGAIARKVIDALLATARPGVREAEVFAEMDKKGLAQDERVMFFANYYVGLNEQLTGDPKAAREHLQRAVQGGENRERGYMWQVARLQFEALPDGK